MVYKCVTCCEAENVLYDGSVYMVSNPLSTVVHVSIPEASTSSVKMGHKTHFRSSSKCKETESDASFDLGSFTEEDQQALNLLITPPKVHLVDYSFSSDDCAVSILGS